MAVPKWLLPLTTIGLLMLASSIALNFFLYNRLYQYYIELNQTRLDPSGLNYFPGNSLPSTRGKRQRVVFFGDSRAASWMAPAIEGYEFINRGINSQTTIQTVQRFDQHVRSLQPDIIVIQVGINDLKTIPLFPEQREAIVSNCQNNIERIVRSARKLGAKVMITTIFPVGEVPLERRPVWSKEVGEAVIEVNAFITQLSDDGIVVFDAFSVLANEQGTMQPNYGLDELHLNQQGYEILNQALIQQL